MDNAKRHLGDSGFFKIDQKPNKNVPKNLLLTKRGMEYAQQFKINTNK